MLKKTVIAIVACALIWVAMIYFWQDRMIYFPRGYASNSRLFKKVDTVKYLSGDCVQVSYLYPAGREQTPQKVWWLYGGNGSTALDWISMLETTRLPEDCVCVLVDYPGYGRCRGKPAPDAIFTSVETLHSKLCEKWNLEGAELSRRSGTLGHSLGAAVAFRTAAHFRMPVVIAVSPFTTMQEMAQRRVGFLHVLLEHPYDNRESVTRLVGQSPPAEIQIFHGTSDSLIPASMGRELAELAGSKNAVFHPVRGRGHNDIIHHIREELLEQIKGGR